MPIELLANHPTALGMNGAAFGHLMRLALHFWLTDCRPLPVVDNQLYVLARAYPATWKANRDEIKAVLTEVTPVLAEAMALWRKRRSVLDHLSERGVSARQSVRLERRLKLIDAAPAIGSPDRSQIAERNRAPAPAETPLKSGFREKIR